MRLWHWKLLPYLPKSQLVAQWRELNSIYVKQDKHILINYIYEYDRVHLLAYSLLVISEMEERGIKINSLDNFTKFFEYTRLMSIDQREKFEPFPEHHNYRYLRQCFYNLQEKYDRGQKDFTRRQYQEINKLMLKEKEVNQWRFQSS